MEKVNLININEVIDEIEQNKFYSREKVNWLLEKRKGDRFITEAEAESIMQRLEICDHFNKTEYQNLPQEEPEWKKPVVIKNNTKTESMQVLKPLAEKKQITLKGLGALPPRKYFIKRLGIEESFLACLCASGNSAKTWVLQYIGCCVSSGLPLFGQFPVTQGTVLHIDEEQNEDQTQRRYERIAGGLGLMELNIERANLNRRLDCEEEIKQAEDDLVELFKGKSLILIDSLKKTTEADENSGDIEEILKIMKRAATRSKAAIILIHHKGKSTGKDVKQTGRGHSSIYDSMDIQIDLDWDRATDTGILSCAKVKEGKMFDDIKFNLIDTGDFNEDQNCSERIEFKFIGETPVVNKSETTLETRILSTLNKEGTTIQSKLFDTVSGSRKLFDEAIESLKDRQLIREERGAKNARIFSITESGISTLEWSK